jgi:hypothetical protein
MTYALIKDNTVIEYPVFEGEIKLRFPNTSFSIPFVPPDEYQLVKDIPIPSVTYEQNVTEGTPQLVDGVWTKIWIITDANEEEILFRTENKAQSVRIQRNSLLFQSDWTQTKDAPVNSDLWQVYRQNLRDIPNQIGFPWEVEWPSKPS